MRGWLTALVHELTGIDIVITEGEAEDLAILVADDGQGSIDVETGGHFAERRFEIFDA